jgi:hypothetical protein
MIWYNIHLERHQLLVKIFFELIESLPSRIYRDSAEVAMTLGELKSVKNVREANEVEST